MAVAEMEEAGFEKMCLSGGTALGGVKMPGGLLPWEIDVDFRIPNAVSFVNYFKIIKK